LTLPFISSENRKLCELCEYQKKKKKIGLFFLCRTEKTQYIRYKKNTIQKKCTNQIIYPSKHQDASVA
jgi:hypothetical protein